MVDRVKFKGKVSISVAVALHQNQCEQVFMLEATSDTSITVLDNDRKSIIKFTYFFRTYAEYLQVLKEFVYEYELLAGFDVVACDYLFDLET